MTRTLLGLVSACVVMLMSVPVVFGDCTLDHFFFGQDEGKLVVDNRRIYRHGETAEGYYQLSWSMIYGCWSVGEPGFSDTSDPAYGMPEKMLLDGTRNIDYQIWVEVLDLTTDFKIKMDDGSWLTQVGQRYNLSSLIEHHAHMKYRAYVPSSPTPEYPFYVTYRLVDDFGTYEASAPFSCAFNVPVPTVEETLPLYCSAVAGRTAAQMAFTFHQPISVQGGPPVSITDETTQTQDYYTGFFDYEVSPDGLTLSLNQVSSILPDATWLEVSLTENVKDAGDETHSVVPFTLFVNTLPGDMNGDGELNGLDIAAMTMAVTGWEAYRDAYPGCHRNRADCNVDGTIDIQDVAAFVALLMGL